MRHSTPVSERDAIATGSRWDVALTWRRRWWLGSSIDAFSSRSALSSAADPYVPPPTPGAAALPARLVELAVDAETPAAVVLGADLVRCVLAQVGRPPARPQIVRLVDVGVGRDLGQRGDVEHAGVDVRRRGVQHSP
jgi:hypothetical protein